MGICLVRLELIVRYRGIGGIGGGIACSSDKNVGAFYDSGRPGILR